MLEISHAAIGSWYAAAEILWVQDCLVAEDVDQRGEIRLDQEEKALLDGNTGQSQAEIRIVSIGPDSLSDKVRVPGNSGCEGDDAQG